MEGCMSCMETDGEGCLLGAAAVELSGFSKEGLRASMLGLAREVARAAPVAWAAPAAWAAWADCMAVGAGGVGDGLEAGFCFEAEEDRRLRVRSMNVVRGARRAWAGGWGLGWDAWGAWDGGCSTTAGGVIRGRLAGCLGMGISARLATAALVGWGGGRGGRFAVFKRAEGTPPMEGSGAPSCRRLPVGSALCWTVCWAVDWDACCCDGGAVGWTMRWAVSGGAVGFAVGWAAVAVTSLPEACGCAGLLSRMWRPGKGEAWG